MRDVNYDALCLFTLLTRLIVTKFCNPDLFKIFEHVIHKCCDESNGLYRFRESLIIFQTGPVNENVDKSRSYTRKEIDMIIKSKISIHLKDYEFKYSLFNNKLRDCVRILGKWEDFDIKEELMSMFPDTRMINHTKHLNAFERRETDIFKDPHDISLHKSSAIMMWSNVFEVIIFEACLFTMTAHQWRTIHERYGYLFNCILSNFEVNIFVYLCMMKFDACLFMYNLDRGTNPIDMLKYGVRNDAVDDTLITPRFAFFLYAHYASYFVSDSYSVTDVMEHVSSQRHHCECLLCFEVRFLENESFKKTLAIGIDSVDTFFGVVSRTFYFIRELYGKHAIDLIEQICIGDVDNASAKNILEGYQFNGVIFFDIGLILDQNGREINLQHKRNFDTFLTSPVICLDNLDHFDEGSPMLLDMNAVFCEIPALSLVNDMPNFYAYLFAYYNLSFIKRKSRPRIRKWPFHVKERDEMLIFQHGTPSRTHTGIYFKSGLLFDAFFRAYNDAIVFSECNVEMNNTPVMKLADMASSLAMSMTTHFDQTHDKVCISKTQNRCAIISLNNIIKNFDKMMFAENDYERSFVFAHIINKLTPERLWFNIILPYVNHQDCIVDSSTFEVARFSNVGVNFVASIRCFFANPIECEKAMIRYDAVQLIEEKLIDQQYIVRFVDVVQKKKKTRQTDILSMMPVTKRFLDQSNRYHLQHPNEDYIPLTGFDVSTYELLKMIYALCCMDEIFTNEESMHIFICLRLNEQTSVLPKKLLYRKHIHVLDDSPDEDDNPLMDLFFNLIYASCFSTNFTIPSKAILMSCSSLNIDELEASSIHHNGDHYVVHGFMQAISSVTYAQQASEKHHIYIGAAHDPSRSLCKPAKTSSSLYHFPLPIFVPKNANLALPSMLSDHIPRLRNEEALPYSVFEKKEFCQYKIPECALSFLNRIENCNKLFFSV